MILLIDNYDSFTYNLYQQISNLGAKVKVLKNDEVTISQIKKLRPKKIVISPGPQTPKESGISIQTIKTFYKSKPTLGVCLGHQCIGEIFGAKTIKAKKILHGKTSQIHHTKDGLFTKIKSPLTAARYHSLAISKLPPKFTLKAWTKDKEIMAIQHEEHPLYGIQFHPESFMTPQGGQIIKNFLNAQ